ncbi:RagB/SusD family nutrient uptake outer membrane protein [Pedobacter psychroterrae]|nr:RagB/SusD family nutrient uptake outer membrane protein [Pedobacter psychroterrae]
MKKIAIVLVALCMVLGACQKEYLEKKPQKSLLVPRKLPELQALLDNVTLMNRQTSLTWIAGDDFTASDAGVNSFLSVSERNSYRWNADIYEGISSSDWNVPYEQTFCSNIILEALAEYPEQEQATQTYRSIKGAALFFRAFALYNLLQEFAVPYDPQTAASVMGLPIRTQSDINLKPGRGTLAESYAQVMTDLESALTLVPEKVPYNTRPGKAAVLGYLARTSLTMQNYPLALKYASDCLAQGVSLIDFNTTAPYLSPNGNVELIFNAGDVTSYSYIGSAEIGLSPSLFDTYATDDLRKTLFYFKRPNGNYYYRGSYSQNVAQFHGLATDEVLLIKAEAAARTGDLSTALQALNELMQKRWKADTFQPFATNDQNEAIRLILEHRRKELVGRGTRWTDLRRLNQDPQFAVTINRTVAGVNYVLLPNDPRYTYPIPDGEINGSGIPQNPR